jgi:ribosomal protein L11 methyltransferase
MTLQSIVPWALTLTGPNEAIYAIGEALGFDDVMDALSISIFEAETRAAGDSPNSVVQALYETQADAESALSRLSVPSEVSHSIEQLPETDWVSLSQQGLPPVEAGRFWVYGSHDKDNVPQKAEHPILVDAGLAFGTGHHGTTKGCLLIFDALLDEGFAPKTVLDLGTGAGTLAIAAAMSLPVSTNILATDIDHDSVLVTQENARVNGVGERLDITQADGFESDVFKERSFELIFANILAGPLMGLAPDIASALAPKGKVILSGIIDEMAEAVTEAFTAQDLSVTPQPSLEGWTSLLAVKS